MNMQTAITADLRRYTRAEGRAWEDHLLRHWTGAGKSRLSKPDTFQAYKNTGGSTIDWPARESEVLELLDCGRPMKMPEMVEACPKMGRAAVTSTLNRLLARGKVQRLGASSTTRWALAGFKDDEPHIYWNLYNAGLSKAKIAEVRGVHINSVTTWAKRNGVTWEAGQ